VAAKSSKLNACKIGHLQIKKPRQIFMANIFGKYAAIKTHYTEAI